MTLSLLALNSICDSRGEIKLLRFVFCAKGCHFHFPTDHRWDRLLHFVSVSAVDALFLLCACIRQLSQFCKWSIEWGGVSLCQVAQNVFRDNEHVTTCITGIGATYEIAVAVRDFGRVKRRWEDNIKIHFNGTGRRVNTNFILLKMRSNGGIF